MHVARMGEKEPDPIPAKLSAHYVGCSGWFYWHWRGRFYPAHIKTRGWFEHYAQAFNTVELNAPTAHASRALAD